MNDPLVGMSDEDLIAQGYLIIRHFGNMTQYIPTDKYRATMMLPPRTAMTIIGSEGEFVFDPGEVYYICGECGENIHPRCACPLTGHTVPAPFKLLTACTDEDDMRPQAPTEILISAQRPTVTVAPEDAGRYSLVSSDVPDGEEIPYNASLHVETVTLKVGKK